MFHCFVGKGVQMWVKRHAYVPVLCGKGCADVQGFVGKGVQMFQCFVGSVCRWQMSK